MFPLIDQDVLVCEACDQPVCVTCHPEDIFRCAGGDVIHCQTCSEACAACAQDRLDALGVDE